MEGGISSESKDIANIFLHNEVVTGTCSFASRVHTNECQILYLLCYYLWLMQLITEQHIDAVHN